MKAIVYDKYGSIENLRLEEVAQPAPEDHEVLIKIHAVSLNSSDFEFLKGEPIYTRMWGLLKPKYKILGSDIAGVIQEVGENVTQFKVGDEVFGDNFLKWGGCAEYVCVPEISLVKKPTNLTFEEAAAIPQAGVVALQGLRDKGQIQDGQKILINGAGGGAGTFAIQISKMFETEVTGVDSTEKLDLMKTLGADHVIDYSQEDFTASSEHRNEKGYDLILDLVAHHSIFDYNRVLSPKGKYVLVGGSMTTLFQVAFIGSLMSLASKKKLGILGHKQNTKDMDYMVELFTTGKVKPVIDRIFSLKEAPQAFQFLGDGRAKGKLVVTI